MDRTLVICKPDAVERGLVGEIIARFERRDLSVVAMELRQVTDDPAGESRLERGLAGGHIAYVKGTELFEQVAEITGRSSPDMELRMTQLREYKVFEKVVAEIEQQLQIGERAIAPFAQLAPVPRLLALGTTLRTQVDLLKANA